jgi:hypothetical protein
VSGQELFYTRAPANAGRRVDLRTPSGEKTEHWLLVRSRWSDECRAAKDAALQAAAGLRDPDEIQAAIRAAEVDVLASLIAGWSFPEPCNAATAREFLANAPQIAAQVDKFAGDDVRFFGSGSTGSSVGPDPNSRSGTPRRDRKPR